VTKTTKDILLASVVIGTMIGGYVYLVTWAENKQATVNSERMEVVCPSFLSISRSARDTLIVMRNEPLCNRYVLDNLK
jgi:hypothetical protein